jgi:hypothetical protein
MFREQRQRYLVRQTHPPALCGTGATGFGTRGFLQCAATFAAGAGNGCIPTPFGLVGVSICFETLYPDYIRRTVRAVAELLVNLSNDGWLGDSNMPELHLRAAQFRPIENRRFMLRAANSGVSAVIIPLGKIALRSRLFERATIAATTHPLTILSVYGRLGDHVILWAGIVFLFASLGRIFSRGASCFPTGLWDPAFAFARGAPAWPPDAGGLPRRNRKAISATPCGPPDVRWRRVAEGPPGAYPVDAFPCLIGGQGLIHIRQPLHHPRLKNLHPDIPDLLLPGFFGGQGWFFDWAEKYCGVQRLRPL